MSNGTIQHSDTLSGWLQWAASQYGDRVAVLSEESDPITHAALYDCVVGLRAELRRCGVGRSDRVAILLPQGPGLALAFLAVAASATAAPLNPATSAAELETTLRELEPRALILARGSFAEARSVATRLGVAVLDLDPIAGGAGRPRLHGTGPSPRPWRRMKRVPRMSLWCSTRPARRPVPNASRCPTRISSRRRGPSAGRCGWVRRIAGCA